jgi:hypothetical protein
MSSARTAAAPGSVTNRSKLTNNPRRIPGIDNRTAAGRRRRDLVDAFIAGLGGEASPVKLAEVRRAADLTALAEEMRAKALKTGTDATEAMALVRLEGAASRARRALGLKETASDANFLDQLYGDEDDAEAKPEVA